MAVVPRSPETIYSWRDICERVDGPNRHLDSLYPVVYYWTSGASRRDSGPMSGIYHPGEAPVGPTDIQLSQTIVQEQTIAAPVGTVTVIGPNVAYTITAVDLTDAAILWTVDGNLLRLADGQQIIFDPLKPVHTVEIRAVAPNSLFVTRDFGITVQQIIIPPPPNLPPTDIQLDSTSIDEKVLGAVVGNITVLDPNLPNDTEVVVCSDARFVVIPGSTPGTGILQLLPSQQVVFATEPTIAFTLTATDSTGNFITIPFTINVIPQTPTGRAHSAGFSQGFS